MSSNPLSSPRSQGFGTDDRAVPSIARFAISAMDGKFKVPESQLTSKFMTGLIALVQNDAMCALEKLLSSSGSRCLQNALTIQMNASFWKKYVIPLLEALSGDELQLGCRSHLTTTVFQNMMRIPFFLTQLSEFVASDIVDPLLALSIVDRSGTADRSLNEDGNFMAVVSVLGKKLDGHMRDHLLIKFKDGDADEYRKKESILQDTTLNTLRELTFDRHDNDFENVADIELLPTKQELDCPRPPYLPLASNPMATTAILFETHFRWLREDMVAPIRESIALLRSGRNVKTKQKNCRVLQQLRALTFRATELDCLQFEKLEGTTLAVSFSHPSPFKAKKLRKLSEAKVMQLASKHYDSYWKARPRVLRRGSVVVFIQQSDGDFVRFGEVVDGNRLGKPLQTNAEDGKSTVTVRFDGTQFSDALSDMIAERKDLLMVQLNVSFFSYKPILRRLQQMKATDIVTTLLPEQLSTLHIHNSPLDRDLSNLSPELKNAVEKLKNLEVSIGIKSILPKCSASRGSFTLDKQQCMAVELAFSRPVSLIQGPPGTGKSLCGAVIGAFLHRFTNLRILCLCYTNHALDDFLNDLINIGVPDSDILRIGSGCRADESSRIAKTRLDAVRARFRLPVQRPLKRLMAGVHEEMSITKEKALSLHDIAKRMGRKSWKAVKEYLLEHEGHLLDAFSLSSSIDGFTVAGLSEGKLWENWITGKEPPESMKDALHNNQLWSLPKSGRQELLAQWIRDAVSHIGTIRTEYDRLSARLKDLYDEQNGLIMQSRRIIGCTTTGASSFSRLLDGSAVDVLIMEEAGEILEAHSIAAIGKRVQQIVLIGDHLQLRPKIENYLLGVEGSEGRYGLDVSLFERLIQSGVPHITLEQQHRMCRSVAAFVTELTYPSLRTAPTVRRRKLIGAPHNVMFVDHSELEDSLDSPQASENTLSKTNTHEVKWVLAITQYLLHQPEYSADDIVVLTPYLGQLVILRNTLAQLSNTAVGMNERDIADLIKAGENVDSTESNGPTKHKRIRVATVDNFQGEEGNIIVASLVRSNDSGTIGFLAQPQRVNVLLSRAREAMIFVGNSSTLTRAKKGGGMWAKVIEIFQKEGSVDRGITLSCPKHGSSQLLRRPEEFAEKVPNGGCDLPCEAKLNCDHSCAMSCHRGPCSPTCQECSRQKQLQQEKEELAQKRKQVHIQNQNDIETLQHEADLKRERLLEKQEETAHAVEMERLKHENDLLERESKLIEEAGTQKAQSTIQRLRKRCEKEMKALEARYADPSDGKSDDVTKTSTAHSKRAKDEQQVAGRHADKGADVHSTTAISFGDETEKDSNDSESVDSAMLTPKVEWQHVRLKVSFKQRRSMDKLMQLTGLQTVKNIALDIFKKHLADEQLKADGLSASIVKPTLNFSFVGNPGTGKTTVAKLFAGMLAELGLRTGSRFENVTASELLMLREEKFAARISSMCGNDVEKAPPLGRILRRNLKVEVQSTDKRWYAAKIINVDEEKNVYTVEYASDSSEETKVIRDRIRAGSELGKNGEVLFIDEAYDLSPSRNSTGAAIVNVLMEAAEKHREKLTIILAGYQKDIETELFAFNDGMPSRFREVVFDDFDESELRRIWEGMCKTKGYLSHTKVTEVAARYVGRGRGVRGFGNARSVRSVFERACSRSLQRRTGNDLRIEAADVLGPRPASQDPRIARVMDELNDLIGLRRVKDSFRSLVDLARSNYDREMRGLPSAMVPLNRVFVGNPGTGKTTVARLYGSLLKALGFLSNGEVVPKVASDLMGEFIGQAQQRTKAIVENARGKVLLIDEAYGLDDKMYGKQALDTLVERVSGAPGEDIAVVLVGYEENIRKMIDGQNPGLKRRFNMEICKVLFDDFDQTEIHSLVGLECQRAGVKICDEVHVHATKLLMKQRAKPNFGNAGNVVSLVRSAVGRLTSRTAGSADWAVLSIRDIDPNFEPDMDPLAPLHDLEDTPVKKHLLDLALQLQVRKKEGRSTDGLLGNYVFTGAPGTGKTTIARKLGKILFNMGILASDLVVETSSSDLIGSYIGHSRENVENKMKEARGGVCFIDEAYHLGVGPFGIEALTQLLTMLTLPEYMDGKTIVILAGYDKEIHNMLECNPGLKSRFTSYLRFEDWSRDKCVSFVCKLAGKEHPVAFTIDERERNLLRNSFEEIRSRPGWANARDVIHVYKLIITARDVRIAKGCSSTMEVEASLITTEDIDKAVSQMLQARPAASAPAENELTKWNEVPVQVKEGTTAADMPHVKEQESLREKQQSPLGGETKPQIKSDIHHDDESDEDKKNDKDDFYSKLLREVMELDKTYADNPKGAHAMGCKAESERLAREKREHDKMLQEKEQALKRARDASDERKRQRSLEIAQQKEEELQRRRAKELQRQRIRRALMTIGKCVQGFRWRRIGNGYRCEGGTHYASFKQIAVETGISEQEVNDAFKE